MLQEIVRRKLDLLVPPLCCAVDAGDQGRTVHTPEVAEDKCGPGLRLVGDALSEAEMPGGVLLPGMPLQERVLIIRTWLHLAPFAVEHVLPGVDQSAAVGHCCLVQRV